MSYLVSAPSNDSECHLEQILPLLEDHLTCADATNLCLNNDDKLKYFCADIRPRICEKEEKLHDEDMAIINELQQAGVDDVNDEPFWYIEHTFDDRHRVKELKMTSHEDGVEVPEYVGKLGALTHLSISAPQLEALPESLITMTSLTSLHLEMNNFEYEFPPLPTNLNKLKSLTSLNLHQCNLVGTIDNNFFDNLGSLTSLDLSENHLYKLPDSFSKLTNLTDLNLSGNNFSDIIHTLPSLLPTSLIKLNLHGNSIERLPEGAFQNLESLTSLDLSKNRLTDLPNDFGIITRLSHLNLDGNDLKKLPECFKKLNVVEFLNLFRNPIKRLRRLTYQQSNQHFYELPDIDFMDY